MKKYEKTVVKCKCGAKRVFIFHPHGMTEKSVMRVPGVKCKRHVWTDKKRYVGEKVN